MKKVKIVHKGFSDHAWYNKFLGQSFELIEERKEDYLVKINDTDEFNQGTVEKVDGEIIDEEINTHPVLQDLLQQQKNDVKRQFETGAVRDNSDNKPNVHDIQGYTLLRVGYHLKTGEKHYGKSNYLKGIPSDVALESLARHYAKYHAGNREEDHLSAIIFNAQLLMLNEEKEGIKADKYFNYKKK